MKTEKKTATECTWCGSTDQNLVVTSNGKPACEDWKACSERELKKSSEKPLEVFPLPFGRAPYPGRRASF